MRLIDADALHRSIDTEAYRHTYIEQIHEIIDNAPTIDADPLIESAYKYGLQSGYDNGWRDASQDFAELLKKLKERKEEGYNEED